MNNFGFLKVMAYVPPVRIGDMDFNVAQLLAAVNKADKEDADIMVTPELGVTGYTCADLFNQELLLGKAENAISEIRRSLNEGSPFFVVGCPLKYKGRLYNCAVVFAGGEVKGIVPKSYIPNYGEFYEKRWFNSGREIREESLEIKGVGAVPFGVDLIFEYEGAKIGIEICEDLWVPEPPSGKLAMAGADIILNLSATDELIGKHDYILSLVKQQSARCRCGYVYCSAGWGESSTDLVFAGNAIVAENGIVLSDAVRFNPGAVSVENYIDVDKLNNERLKFNTFFDGFKSGEFRLINCRDIDSLEKNVDSLEKDSENSDRDNEIPIISDPFPFVPHDSARLKERCEEIINIQSYGLMKRLEAIGCRKAVVGVSGGLDSTLALLVTVRAFDLLGYPRKDVIGITMPGLATTSRTKSNAVRLMELLGVTTVEIAIGGAVEIHFKDIGQDKNKYDVTYENSQARERTQILMDYANKENAIVVGTGDMSELALGWCTYNGDQMSMYGVNAGVPKTLVRHLVTWFANESPEEERKILLDIVDTPISPELVPSGSDNISQKTEDLVGPYELHDFFLYHFLRNSFSPKKIYKLALRSFENQYNPEVIVKWLKVFYRRFFSQQFKRSAMPDGPKVGSVSLSPRGDWRMASDSSVSLWLKELEDIKL